MKNNYVFFIRDQIDLERYYSDLIGRKDVFFIRKKEAFENALLNRLFSLSFSQTINNHFPVVWKVFFFKKLLNLIPFEKDEHLVLLFHAGWYDRSFIEWLDKNYPMCKRVIYFDDTINCYEKAIKKMDHKRFNEEFDLILCYNKGDADRHGFTKCNAYFSKDNTLICDNDHKSDLVFIGQPKDRQKTIEEIYKTVSGKCSCNFVIVNGKGDVEGITYMKKGFSYHDYLTEEVNSNCLLEVIKGDTDSETLRCWEAVYYNKKLLTNWKGIFDFKYYNPKYMKYFEKPSDIDADFILKKEKVDYCYEGDNSPRELIALIERKLES